MNTASDATAYAYILPFATMLTYSFLGRDTCAQAGRENPRYTAILALAILSICCTLVICIGSLAIAGSAANPVSVAAIGAIGLGLATICNLCCASWIRQISAAGMVRHLTA